MSSPPKPIEDMLALFEQQPCWKISPLAEALQYAVPSVRRFLAQTGYYSSFTHNGVWYTLRSIPSFNRRGLWFYQDIGFSKAGPLTATIVGLIQQSQAGMTAEDLGDILRCRCHSVLVNLYRQGRLQRQKQGRSYIYFAGDPQTANSQRRAKTLQQEPAKQLPAEIAVYILAEYIKRPQADFPELAHAISAKGVSVSPAQIENLFAQHGIKKKT
ncbi:MAG: hypothetical protein K9K82_13635 [Desulfobacteraceae bacterium]|nr:hypothetical protein [Desulfobacteraceae bacterium]